THPRALDGMERHEERAEHLAEDDRHEHPEKAQSKTDADEPNRQCRELGICEEPQRRLVGDVPMAFCLRDVVDGVELDSARGCLSRRSSHRSSARMMAIQ